MQLCRPPPRRARPRARRYNAETRCPSTARVQACAPRLRSVGRGPADRPRCADREMVGLAPHAAPWGVLAAPLSSAAARRGGLRGVRASAHGPAPRRAVLARRHVPAASRRGGSRCALSQPGPFQGDAAAEEVRAGCWVLAGPACAATRFSHANAAAAQPRAARRQRLTRPRARSGDSISRSPSPHGGRRRGLSRC